MRKSNTCLLIILIALAITMLVGCATPPATQPSAPVMQSSQKTAELEKEGASQPKPIGTSAGAAIPTEAPAPPTFLPLNTQAAAPAVAQPTQGEPQSTPENGFLPSLTPFPTQISLPTASAAPTLSVTQPAEPPNTEAHFVQVEWPLQMRLGESDIVRLSLVPSSQGYSLVTEYPEHQVVTQTVTIRPASGYELFAVARLDGVGFDISPSGEIAQYLITGDGLGWRWSLTPRQTGRQRLSLTLSLRWIPESGSGKPNREIIAFSRPLDIRVISFFGLTQAQALLTGLVTLLLGGGLSLFSVVIRPRPARLSAGFELHQPNPSLAIELPPDLHLGNNETTLLQALFQRYARLVIQQEFLSGYSGARTFLALPIRQDGRADAYTITKIGARQAMQREYHNYETFVKDTLPPITARIQRPPVSASTSKGSHLVALQYTFIGEPGHPPKSLRQALLAQLDPGLLFRLLDTFGPNWWLQRRPYTFRTALEYDRVLPTHLVIEPASGRGQELDGRLSPVNLGIKEGDLVTMRNFSHFELRQDGVSFSAQGPASPGQPPLRIRWLGSRSPEGATGKVIATRVSLLSNFVEGSDLLGLPDPLYHLQELLSETMHASQSIIHGDLNLENILVGPGGMLWLIDFAQTREGHALFDFAHLEAEIIGQVIAPKVENPADYLDILRGKSAPQFQELASILAALQEIASRCLFNPSEPTEYRIALILSCIGALKFNNLSPHAQHLLYLTAAELIHNR